MESVMLNEQQRLYLQTIFDYFNEHGTWPTYSYVERTLHQSHPHLDIDEIVKSLPPGLSKPFNAYLFDVPGYANEDTFLTIPAIYVCQGSEEVLKDFVRVIRFCVERYNSSDKEKRQVTSDDLITLLDLPALSTCKIGLLLQVRAMDFFFLLNGRRRELAMHTLQGNTPVSRCEDDRRVPGKERHAQRWRKIPGE